MTIHVWHLIVVRNCLICVNIGWVIWVLRVSFQVNGSRSSMSSSERSLTNVSIQMGFLSSGAVWMESDQKVRIAWIGKNITSFSCRGSERKEKKIEHECRNDVFFVSSCRKNGGNELKTRITFVKHTFYSSSITNAFSYLMIVSLLYSYGYHIHFKLVLFIPKLTNTRSHTQHTHIQNCIRWSKKNKAREKKKPIRMNERNTAQNEQQRKR